MKIAVVGAGNMGSGIAQKYATEGFTVTLYDNNHANLERGQSNIERTLTEAVARNIFSEQRCAHIKNRLHYTSRLADLAHQDLIIEAVFEDLAVKKALFLELDGLCDAKTCFATNTSSFLVEQLALATQRADRVVGLHYFYHPAKNKLVEVIRGTKTSDATFSLAWELQEKINKLPIRSHDAPGFVVNRFFVPWLNEAMRIKQEGLANIATIEAAAKACFGIGMGPFELMNVTGLPITLHAATALGKALGPFYDICPLIHEGMAQAGWDLTGAIDHEAFLVIQERLMGQVFWVATQMVLEDRVCSIEDCDLGARVGLRWAKGPFELMADDPLRAQRLIASFQSRYHLKDAPHYLEIAHDAKALCPKRVSIEREGQLGIVTLNRPDALNALDLKMVTELEQAFEQLGHDEAIDTIVLRGKGKAFAAGADTQFFVDRMRTQHVQDIVDFARFAQHVFMTIDGCKKKVICAISGMALGGGLELALACDAIVAESNASLGFPETGIGIYPGLGGTQRTTHRAGVALARWLVLSGETLTAEEARDIGLIDAVCAPGDLLKTAHSLIGAKRPALRPLLATSFKEIESLFEQPLDRLLSEEAAANERARNALKKLKTKAPLALKAADRLIQSAPGVALLDGLALETAGLFEIFSTQDAWVGISSIGKAKPSFSGT